MVVLNLAVYAPTLHYGFISYDDPEYVTKNHLVLAGLTWRGIKWAFTMDSFAYWHPLTWLSLMLDSGLYGGRAGGFHLTNLLMHVASTLLLFAVLRRTTGALGRSAFVAALFAVHPLHVETVAWVSERKGVLSTLFWMLTMWAYARYVREPRPGRYLAALLIFALGLMAKPMLVTLPFVLLLLDVWPLGRVPLEGPAAGPPGGAAGLPGDAWAGLRSAVPRLVMEKLPMLFLAAACGAATLLVVAARGVLTPSEAVALGPRLARAAAAYVSYIGMTLWPIRLSAFYPVPRELPIWWVGACAAGLLTVSLAVIRTGRRWPFLAVGWFWYLGTLAPVIGVIRAQGSTMTNRYTYVPLIGIFIMIAWGIEELFPRRPHRTALLGGAAALALAACAFLARDQVRLWGSDMALWTRALETTSDNHVAHNILGSALLRDKKVDEAVSHFREALRIKPDYVTALSNLGGTLLSQGKVAEALPYLSKALRLKPDFAPARSHMGIALALQGRTGEALAQYSEAVRLDPGSPEKHMAFGLALRDQGKLGEAMAHFQEALLLRPGLADAHINLGIALAGQARIDEALSHFAQAVRLEPGNAVARVNLGLALAREGRVDEAILQFSQALDAAPDSAAAHYNLAILLYRRGETGEARRHLEAVLRIEPGHRAARRALDGLRSAAR